MNKIVVAKNKNNLVNNYSGVVFDNEKIPSKIGPAEIENFSDKDLYDYCRFTGINARIWSRRFVVAIPEVARRGLYKKYGFYSVYEFAAKVAGISRKNTNETLRIYEKFKELPKMKELIGKVGLSKLRVVACVVTLENEWFWAKKAVDMSRPALEVLVREIKDDEEKKIIENNKSAKLPLEDKQKDDIIVELDRNNLSDNSVKLENNQTLWPKFPWEPELIEVDKFQKPERINFSVPVDLDTDFQLRKFKLKLEKASKEPVDWNSTLKELVKRAAL